MARKAAQLVVVPSLDFNIDQLGPAVSAGAGGMLFLGNAPAPADLAARVGRAAALAPPDAPLLTMADEEGGGVQRVAGLVGSLPWPRALAAADTPEQVTRLAAAVAERMRGAGVGMDLAPVLDVDGGAGPSASDADGQRSFSALPPVAAAYGVAFIKGVEAGGVIAVAKHFPGLGGASGNTDVGPSRTLPLASLRSEALPPFTAAIAAGVPAVMVANATVPGLSAGPASLSPAVIEGLLRGELGFSGLVLTDSLSAGAIAQAGYSVPGAAVAAIEAGADMVLFGSTLTPAQVALLAPGAVRATFESIVQAIQGAVASGQLPQGRLDAAVLHVLAVKGPRPACGPAASP